MNRKCMEVRSRFSSYLDGAISGQEMQEIARHLEGGESRGQRIEGCEACARELAAWRLTQNALGRLGPAKAPDDLALKLRIAISHENARRQSRWTDWASLAWDNSVRPSLVQVSAGVAGSVLLGCMVLLLGAVAAPQPVLANDEPLGAITEPHLLSSAFSAGDLVSPHDAPVVVEALVNASGRVYDYKIVSGPQDESTRIKVAYQLLGDLFQPASAFGVPVRGRVLMTFSGISVHG